MGRGHGAHRGSKRLAGPTRVAPNPRVVLNAGNHIRQSHFCSAGLNLQDLPVPGDSARATEATRLRKKSPNDASGGHPLGKRAFEHQLTLVSRLVAVEDTV